MGGYAPDSLKSCFPWTKIGINGPLHTWMTYSRRIIVILHVLEVLYIIATHNARKLYTVLRSDHFVALSVDISNK